MSATSCSGGETDHSCSTGQKLASLRHDNSVAVPCSCSGAFKSRQLPRTLDTPRHTSHSFGRAAPPSAHSAAVSKHHPRGKHSRKQPKAIDYVRPFATVAEERLLTQIQQEQPGLNMAQLTSEFNMRAAAVVRQAQQEERVLQLHERVYMKSARVISEHIKRLALAYEYLDAASNSQFATMLNEQMSLSQAATAGLTVHPSQHRNSIASHAAGQQQMPSPPLPPPPPPPPHPALQQGAMPSIVVHVPSAVGLQWPQGSGQWADQSMQRVSPAPLLKLPA